MTDKEPTKAAPKAAKEEPEDELSDAEKAAAESEDAIEPFPINPDTGEPRDPRDPEPEDNNEV